MKEYNLTTEIYDQKYIIKNSNAGKLCSYSINEFGSNMIKLLQDKELRKYYSKNGFKWIKDKRNFKNMAEKINSFMK